MYLAGGIYGTFILQSFVELVCLLILKVFGVSTVIIMNLVQFITRI